MYHIPSENLTFDNRRQLAAHLGVGIPVTATADTLSPHGAYLVQFDAAPTVTDSQVAEIDATPTHANGVSTLGWTVRDKTAAETAADLLAEREGMEVQRGFFAIAAMQLSHISAVEASAWGAGNSLPANVQQAITLHYSDPTGLIVLDQAGLDAALIVALTRPTIRRLAALVEIVRAGLNITEVQLDAIFVQAQTLQDQG